MIFDLAPTAHIHSLNLIYEFYDWKVFPFIYFSSFKSFKYNYACVTEYYNNLNSHLRIYHSDVYIWHHAGRLKVNISDWLNWKIMFFELPSV